MPLPPHDGDSHVQCPELRKKRKHWAGPFVRNFKHFKHLQGKDLPLFTKISISEHLSSGPEDAQHVLLKLVEKLSG